MAIKYTYVDPKQMSSYQLIEPGEGKFKITHCEEKPSRAGNDMMQITMQLTNTKGQSTLYKEFIVPSDDPSQAKRTATKIYNILNSIGRVQVYGEPLEARHLLQGNGRCIIKTQKSDNPDYADKSVVSQYISQADAMDSMVTDESEFDDSIPF